MIAGAAKSGTTTLCKYLDLHEQVFIPEKKEPKFFLSQHYLDKLNGPDKKTVVDSIVKNFDEYCGLFPDDNNLKALGEGSVDNLYFHKESIPLIKEYLGETKIIIILRNPVIRAFSAYKHLVRNGLETETFERSIELEEERIRSSYMPLWHLKNAGLYYGQVKAFKEHFKQVHIIIFEAFSKNTQKIMDDTFRFLEVEPIQIKSYEVYNKSALPKNRALYQRIYRNQNLLRKTLSLIATEGKYDQLKKMYKSKFFKSDHIKEDTYLQLKAQFIDDIEKLEKLIDQDLSIWK